MQILGVIGTHINSQTKESQGVRLLGRLTIPQELRNDLLPKLKEYLGVDELVYLATCNRVEFVFSAEESVSITDVRNRILDFFFRDNPGISFSPNDFYAKSGIHAGRHLFSVASALDSLVIGEAQILGQIKDAYFFACENNLVGEQLTAIFQRVFKVAKKVRTETELGKKSVSMVSLATSLIQNIIADEGNIPVALIGVGEMTRKMAKYLIGRGITNITVVNRTEDKATALAKELNATGMSLDAFLTTPPAVRIVCTSTGSPEPLFTDDSVAELARVNSKLLFIDLAIPCDVEIEKSVENGLEIYNIDDLKKISDKNRRQRFRDVDKANAIISNEIDQYRRCIVESELKPVFNLSYQEAREYADDGLERLFAKYLGHIDDKDRAQISRFVEKLVGYTTFLPARTLADRIAKSPNGTPQGLSQFSDEEQVRSFRKGA
ncbi:MAG: glutamyl-tRNA reductase [Candidatus Zixiibacteriota bacterium]